MSERIIAISTSSFGKENARPLDLLAERGLSWRLNPHGRTLTEDEAIEHTRGAVGLIAGTEPLTERVFAALDGLKVVSRVGIGMDSVDRAAAERCGITVINTPDAHVDAVAELALGGILAALRHIARGDRAVRTGWTKPMGGLLRGKTIGVVGLGKVGRALVALAKPFGVAVLAVDPVRDDAWAAAHGARYVELPELLREADVVSLHVPYHRDRHHMIGADQLAVMKPTALLVNTARGGLIDEVALAVHLRANKRAGAYLDCFEKEPYSGPLAELDNAVLTPHIGSYAREARVQMEEEAVRNLLRALGA